MSIWNGYNTQILATRFQKIFIKDYLDLSGRLVVQNNDVSFNNRLFVLNDASFMGNMYINGNLTTNRFISNNDVNFNKRLFVLNDVSFISNVYIDKDFVVNQGCISNGNVLLNSNVFVGKDISCNGNINIGRNLTINGNLAIQTYTSQNIINTTTTNYQFVVSKDLSLNGRLSILNDASINGNLFVSKDISLNGNIRVNGAFLKNTKVNSQNTGIRNSVYDTIFGYQTLSAIPSGSTAEKNTAIGSQSLVNIQSGSHNTAFGRFSLYTAVSANYNTAVGSFTMTNAISSNNTAVGDSAGSSLTSGSSNTFIGTASDAAGNNYSNSTAIGYLSPIQGNNQIVLGLGGDTVIISRIERHLAPPIIIRKATSVQTQNISNAQDTNVQFPTSVYDNGFTGLGYDSVNTQFINNNSYPICVYISASVNIPANSTGLRATFIETFNNATYFTGRLTLMDDLAVNTTLSQHVTAITPLQAGASFAVRFYQNTLTTLTINGTDATNYPTIITIRVF